MRLLRILLPVLTALPLFAAAEPALPAGIPYFEKPDYFSSPAGLLERATPVPGGTPRRFFSGDHPLAWYNDFFQLRVRGKEFWASPTISGGFNAAGRIAVWQCRRTPLRRWLLSGVFIAGFVFWAMRMRREPPPPGSPAAEWNFILGAVLLRLMLLSLVVNWWCNLIPAAADDNGYFEVAYDLLHGSVAGPWNYTVGLPLLYIPFAALTGAAKFYDIAVAFDWFAGFFVAPLAMVLGFRLLRRMGLSARAAFAALLVWAAWPFFAWHLEDWENNFFCSFFALPPFELDSPWMWWRYYASCINSGFNAMSDTPGLAAALAAMLAVLALPARRSSAAAVGALWGFACLIRINYIMLLPFFLCAAHYRREEFGGAKRFFAAGVLAAVGFLAIFGFQFFVNRHQFGSMLTFGYSLHYLNFAPLDRPAAGFTFHTLLKWTNLRHLALSNHPWWCAGFAGLLFMRDRRRRNLMVWGSVPLILFFLGYSHTFCDARRFIFASFVLFLGAFTGLEVWSELPGRRRIAIPVAVAAMMLFALPPMMWGGATPWLVAETFGSVAFPAVLAAMVLPPLAVAGFAVSEFRAGRRRSGALLLFLVGYWEFGVPAVAGVLLAASVLRAAADHFVEAAGKPDLKLRLRGAIFRS